MEAQKKGSLKITGAGTAAGGAYETVSISGAGKITGDVQADSISISGTGKIAGNVKADALHASGAFTIDGDAEVQEFRCSGAGKVAGSLRADRAAISGAIHVGARLKAREIVLSGGSKCDADVEAERFRASGAFEIGGLLNADEVDISLGGDSKVREIGGGRIVVRKGVWSGRGLLSGWRWASAILKAESIEGDDVHLENTDAREVRGKRVAIGPGCRIESVEFSESLRVDPSARVGKHAYTGAAASPPPVDTSPMAVSAESAECGRRRGWSVRFGRHEVRNPVARVLAGIFGLLLAAAIVGVVLFVVLPTVGLIVALVLGGVAVLLLALAVGIPVLILGALIAALLWLPFGLLRWMFRRRRRFTIHA